MSPIRRLADIRLDLETALAYRSRYAQRTTDDPTVRLMREANDRQITALELELSIALSAELEMSLEGAAIEDHSVAVPYFQRVLEQLQAAFRAFRRSSLAPGESLPRRESSLRLAGTGPGSFRAYLRVAPTQLDLLQLPPADVALTGILDLLATAQDDDALSGLRSWAAQANEPAVRSMIKLCSTLATSGGRTDLRLTAADGSERLVRVTPEQARIVAVALAGETGRELVTVTGHLQMAQDDPPRVRIITETDQFVASVPSEDLLDRVKELLFLDVTVTLVMDMRTSASTGAPTTHIEMLDLEQA